MSIEFQQSNPLRPLCFLDSSVVKPMYSLTLRSLDQRLNPLPGYSRENCDLLPENGYNQVISWGGRGAISHNTGRIRIRIDFTGIRPEEFHLYAIYRTEAS